MLDEGGRQTVQSQGGLRTPLPLVGLELEPQDVHSVGLGEEGDEVEEGGVGELGLEGLQNLKQGLQGYTYIHML